MGKKKDEEGTALTMEELQAENESLMEMNDKLQAKLEKSEKAVATGRKYPTAKVGKDEYEVRVAAKVLVNKVAYSAAEIAANKELMTYLIEKGSTLVRLVN